MNSATLIFASAQLCTIRGMEFLQKVLATVAGPVHVMLTSKDRSRNIYFPLSSAERKLLIDQVLTEEQRSRVFFHEVKDQHTAAYWCRAVTAELNRTMPGDTQWTVLVDPDDPLRDDLRSLNSTKVEVQVVQGTFSQKWLDPWELASDLLGRFTELSQFDAALNTELFRLLGLSAFVKLRQEYVDVEEYRKQYTKETYHTADAAVFQKGKLLLIRRQGRFGKGMWALPGGFVDPGEDYAAAAYRELEEETGIRLQSADEGTMFRKVGNFEVARPWRSPRAKLVTHMEVVELTTELPLVVTPDSDADDYQWVDPLSLPLYESRLFEDHALLCRQAVDALNQLKREPVTA